MPDKAHNNSEEVEERPRDIEVNDGESASMSGSGETGEEPIGESSGEAEPSADNDADSGHEEGVEETQVSDSEEDKETESERYLRLAAEFDNYRKRTAREFADVVKRANVRLLRELVDIVDNFERALEHTNDDNNDEAYRKGVELIYNQLSALLEKEQVTPIKAVGKPFDPNYHEAMMQAESDEYDEGIVCQVIQKGYKIDDKVLRHARVVVSKGRPEEDEN